MNEHDDPHALTGLYAMDALDDADRERFEVHLATCESCRQEVAEFRATTARLGSAAAEAPPPSLRESVLDAAQRIPQDPAPPGRDPRPAGRARRRTATTRVVVAVAAAIVLVVSGWYALRDTDPGDDLVSTVAAAADARSRPIEGEGWQGRLVWSDAEGRAVLEVDELPDPPSGKVYETWVIDATGAQRSTMFEPDAGGRTVVEVEGFHRDASQIAVTPEPPRGVDSATGDVVASVAM
jgi:anti-sigma-K factor RskA